jgi:LuxR family maltose regulon positive regulatory protein
VPEGEGALSAPLIQTKLYIPPLRPKRVPRPRLVERLNHGLHRTLTLLSAPPGSGKTTLLAEWLAGCGRPAAWVSLDEGDNDLARFLAYVMAALETIEARRAAIQAVREGVLSAFKTPRPPALEAVLTPLINALAAVPDPLLLVLDDYQAIKAAPVHDALGFLLDHAPPQVHVVLASRSDPQLPIARLRGRGQVTELRLADLRFTLEEGVQVLQGAVEADLPTDDLEALVRRTEGWAAGLQMAALAIQGYLAQPPTGPELAPGPPREARLTAFLQALADSDRFILDYLVEEVLHRQPPEVQSFLLQTSILDRLTGELCDAIVEPGWARGQDDQPTADGGGVSPAPPERPSLAPHASLGQAMLERLEAANLFLVPLDGQRRWYRYHRLFADLLGKRLLQQVGPSGVARLHHRASAWYRVRGQRGPAIEHALAAGDTSAAAALIEDAAEPILMRSQVGTLLRWIEALPDDAVRARPRLSAFHAWAMLLGGHPLEGVEARLREALETDTAGIVAGHVAAFRAHLSALRGEVNRSVELSEQALALLPPDSLLLRGMVADNLGVARLFSGDIEGALEALDEAARIARQTGNVMVAVGALCNVAGLCMLQGQLRRAKALYEQALELASDEEGRWLPIAGKALLGLGELARGRNELEAAERYLHQGIERMRQFGEVGLVVGFTSLAFTRQALDDPEGARAAIVSAREAAIRFDATELDDRLVAACEARLWVMQGELERAQCWASERESNWVPAESPPGEPGLSSAFLEISEIERITWVHLRLAQRRPAEALAALEPLAEAAERHGRLKRAVELLAMQAAAYQMAGEHETALDVLNRALELAEPEGTVRVFVDAGAPMARLLYAAASRGMAPTYAGRLLAAFPPAPESRPPVAHDAPSPAPQVEPLSPREREVLELVAQGLSNREIAERLVISLSTVKGHTSNIYGKLAVGSRTQAVARARALGILPAE